MVKIRRALISVYDKTGILGFAKELKKLGFEIISTGGTAKLLRKNNISVIEVSEYTGFPEILSGRVKTLHPKIHAGLLALRDDSEHLDTLKKLNIEPIDMLVVNLYPFKETIKKSGVKLEEVIENIDIGGVALLRSAAKNYRYVAVISNPNHYSQIVEELKENNGFLFEDTLKNLALETFKLTSDYDFKIHSYLKNYFKAKEVIKFPGELDLKLEKIKDLRYGENPHQKAAFYREKGKTKGLINLKQLQGKELSFNNILDLNSAFELVKEFENPAAVIIKHNNPCGVAEDKTLDRAYMNAYNCDQISAFGGVVALNRRLDLKTAEVILKSGFLECIICPSFDKESLEIFKDKKNLRLIELAQLESIDEFDFKCISGGLLLQDKDLVTLDEKILKVVTKRKPTNKEIKSLIFGFKVAKHVKSNAIVLVKGTRTVGIGAGQMSRLDSVFMAIKKAGKLAKGSVLSSDGFFPKEDSIILAKKAEIKAIIQPGGSIKDEKIIGLCNKSEIPMVFTGIRHFKH